MPTEIVTETCPAPECNLTEQDIEQFLEEMTGYIEMFAPAFRRAEQLEWSKAYLRGLLGDTPRKNVERMALDWGDTARSMQHFIGQSPWKAEPVIVIHQRLVAETLGEEDGVALIDESGVVKQGDDSVGVAAQYCGSVGKVANSQIGVYLGYASRKGYRTPAVRSTDHRTDRDHHYIDQYVADCIAYPWIFDFPKMLAYPSCRFVFHRCTGLYTAIVS